MFRCGALTATISVQRSYDGLNRVLFSRELAALRREEACIISWALSPEPR